MSRWWLALFILAPLAASAADPDETDGSGRKIRYKERTEIDFADLNVAGELTGPQIALTNERPKVVFPPLYHPRDQFTDAMVSAVDEVK